MADTSTLLPTLNPFSSTKPRENAPLGGKVGFYDELEAPERSPKVLGSIPFNKVIEKAGNVLADTGVAGIDLAKWVIGVGVEESNILHTEQKIYGEGNPELVQAQSARIEAEAARKRQALEAHLKQLANASSIEVARQNAANSFRLTGKEDISVEAKEQGYLIRDSIATLVGVARKGSEVQEKLREGEERKEAEVFGRGENDLLQYVEREDTKGRNPG